MMLVETTATPEAALPVAGFKAHLRLGTGFAEDGLQDGLLAGFLRAALSAIEARTGKALLEREFRWTLAAWRAEDRQVLPIAPVSALLEIVMIDGDGAETALPLGDWRLLPDHARPVILRSGGTLPAIPTGGMVRIGFRAGFGPEWADLPTDLAQAVMLLAAHYYEYRLDTGLSEGCMPFGVTALIERYRPIRVFGGVR
jgi:uncharacterized phiE125 gp8 family phage protein